jgi:hypothetical protein
VHDRGGPTTVEGRAQTYNFRVVRNYANDQSISRSMNVYDTTVVCALLLRFMKKKRKLGYWVHPIYSERLMKDHWLFD